MKESIAEMESKRTNKLPKCHQMNKDKNYNERILSSKIYKILILFLLLFF